MSSELKQGSRASRGRALSGNLHPIWQFCLLIVPVVMNGFFAVYAVAGLLLEGRDLRNWSLEAEAVALRVGFGIAAFGIVMILIASWRKLGRWHLVTLSGWFHLVVAIVLTILVFMIV